MAASRERQFRRSVRKLLGNSRFVTVLLDDILLRIILVLVFLSLVSVGVLMARVWVTSPKGMTPVRRVTFLDMFRARRVDAQASRARAAGNVDQAASLWRKAMQLNPGDISVFRGSLENQQARGEVVFEQRSEILNEGRWYIGLIRTNQAAMILPLKVFQQMRLWGEILMQTGPLVGGLSAAIAPLRFEAMLHLDRLSEFQRELAALPQSVRDSVDLEPYRETAALLSGGSGALDARRRLLAYLTDPRHGSTAARALFAAGVAASDPLMARQGFLGLEERHTDELVDHARFWRLLMRSGLTAEAMQRADGPLPEVLTPQEAAQIGALLVELRQTDKARAFLEREIAKQPGFEEFWLPYLEIFSLSKDWHGLRSAALRMREVAADSPSLQSLSYVAEAEGAAGLNLKSDTDTALLRLKDFRIDSAVVAMQAVRGLHRIGRYSELDRILLPFQTLFATDAKFWGLLYDTGMALKSPEILLAASRGLEGIQPVAPADLNRIAVGYVSARREPEKAVEATKALLNRFPQSSVAKINHAQALLLNSQTAAAVRLLSEIEEAGLSVGEKTTYWFAMAEASYQRGDMGKARQLLDRVATNSLFPVQIEWISGVRAGMKKP